MMWRPAVMWACSEPEQRLAKEADAHVWGAVISDWVLDFSSKPVFEIITEYITKIIQTNYHKQIVSNVLN